MYLYVKLGGNMDRKKEVLEKDSNLITMVDRALSIVDYIYEKENYIGVSEVSRELDIPKANAFRIIKTLEKWDVLERNSDEKFTLGKRLIKYGKKAKDSVDIVKISTPFMKDLANEIGETVNLGIRYENNKILIVHSEEGESSILVSRLIPISPMYCSSIGKIFLANMSDSELEEYFNSKKFDHRTVNTITNLEQFLSDRATIIEKNIAYDNEEYEYGLTCLSAPIYNLNKDIVACISISGPTSRLKFKGLEEIENKLLDTTRKISSSADILE